MLQLFYDKNIMFAREKKQYQINLVKACYMTKPFRGGRPPLPFFENQKKCPDFGKKCPDCVHPKVKFAIQDVVLSI